MLDNKKIEQSSHIIKTLITEGKIVTPHSEAASFFLKQSRMSLLVSKGLLDLYNTEKLETLLWVINSSYYSMFFAATALLANFKHKINTEIGIHALTYHALVYYFVKEQSKLKTQLMGEYKDAFDDAEQLLQFSEQKIKGFILDFELEMGNRKTFTYELGALAEKKKAELSFQRAQSFFREVEKIIG